MKRAGWIGVLLVAAMGAGCVSTTSSKRFARELISPYQSSLVASRSSEELLIDQGVIEALHTLAAERGQVLRALLHVQQGVHPYLAFVIVESNTGTQGIATSMYWNDVLEKRVSELSPSEVRDLFGAMRDVAECSTGPVEKPLFGTVLVYWESGVQTNCDSGWATEEANAPWHVLSSILDRSRAIYRDGRLALPGSQASNSLQQTGATRWQLS